MHSENSKNWKLFGARDVLKKIFEARKVRLGAPIPVEKFKNTKTESIEITINEGMG
jgi:hypothetical protein